MIDAKLIQTRLECAGALARAYDRSNRADDALKAAKLEVNAARKAERAVFKALDAATAACTRAELAQEQPK